MKKAVGMLILVTVLIISSVSVVHAEEPVSQFLDADFSEMETLPKSIDGLTLLTTGKNLSPTSGLVDDNGTNVLNWNKITADEKYINASGYSLPKQVVFTTVLKYTGEITGDGVRFGYVDKNSVWSFPLMLCPGGELKSDIKNLGGGNYGSSTVIKTLSADVYYTISIAHDVDGNKIRIYVDGDLTYTIDGFKDRNLADITPAEGTGYRLTMYNNCTANLYFKSVKIYAGDVPDEYRPSKFIGVQESVSQEGLYNIRFVASVDSLDYDSVGFSVVATYSTGIKTYDVNCRYVYKEITYTEHGYTSGYKASENGAEYLMALSIIGVPDNLKITFTVTPFVVDSVKGNIQGDAVSFVYENGVFAG
ncbi:MAG: hypothetical protein ACI3XQ_01580 [Eubacteriales bacterium]